MVSKHGRYPEKIWAAAEMKVFRYVKGSIRRGINRSDIIRKRIGYSFCKRKN